MSFKLYAFVTGTEPRQRKPRGLKLDLGVYDSLSPEVFNTAERLCAQMIKDKKINLSSMSGTISAYEFTDLDKKNESNGLIVIKMLPVKTQIILINSEA